ncbi:SDR family oxidoreductase [Pantoea sp. BAV 3049]|uniref:SDR family oxidoreductase n=1 Tax=Pantoea sp. BAV 3049 TaxID=2654188 RepID=UPI00131CEF75|nr:SDR family oxidoreductase [Pantoea sp. BAV 3049]
MATGKKALVVGASRGIGLGLANQLAAQGWEVTATTRSTAPVATSGIRWLTVDINHATQREALKHSLAEEQLDLIFINAGVFGPDHQDIQQSDDAELAALFMTNAISPVRCAAELLPQLAADRGVLALMTSQLASLNENPSATYPLYSASKAALNMLSRRLSALLSPFQTLLCIHPGWVQTDMGGSNASLTVEQSVGGIIGQIDVWQGKGGHHYVEYSGQQLRW